MRKRILVFIYCSLLSIITFAQASGGEIKRTPRSQNVQTNTARISNTQRLPSSPSSFTTDNKEKTYTVEELYKTGLSYYNRGNYTEAMKWLNEAANRGNAYSKYYLGKMIKEGRVVASNMKSSQDLYYEATKSLYIDAKSAMNTDGYNAIQLFNIIIDMGVVPYNVYSFFHIGEIYYYGKGGVNYNYSEAFIYFSKAANIGNYPAYYYMGLCYEYGRGVSKNELKAKQCYEKSTYSKPPSLDF